MHMFGFGLTCCFRGGGGCFIYIKVPFCFDSAFRGCPPADEGISGIKKHREIVASTKYVLLNNSDSPENDTEVIIMKIIRENGPPCLCVAV